ncbi:MAG: PhzF family phenazine biosynthesis isomerase [Saprospiraceae bacterium]|nr:PhzF family phenazine biosynthesis isomerase [Saprospiraceae bacterium]
MKTYFVDSFTHQKFKGNPAAVCLPDSDLDEPTMQNVAMEIGFSETAFVRKIHEGQYSIRFFSPKQEIAICGHATLASAQIVFSLTDLDKIVFTNVNGVQLTTLRRGNKISMQFPVYPLAPLDVPDAMLAALGVTEIIHSAFCENLKIILLELTDNKILDALNPDYGSLLKSYQYINGVCVTARSTEEDFDFHYRFFWPWSGTSEDPVTGGVHTFLTPYWNAKLQKGNMKALQSSQRTGEMEVYQDGDQVVIIGQAVTMLEGVFFHLDV